MEKRLIDHGVRRRMAFIIDCRATSQRGRRRKWMSEPSKQFTTLEPEGSAVHNRGQQAMDGQHFKDSFSETTGTGASVELKLPGAARIDSVVVMEQIARGERIEPFPPTEVTKVRLVLDKAKSERHIRKLAAYGSA